MSAKDTLFQFVNENGWGEDTQIELLCQFIDTYGDAGLKSFKVFLEEYETKDPNISLSLIEFLCDEINNAHAKYEPTLDSAHNSLIQMPDDILESIIIEGDNSNAATIADELKSLIETYGGDYSLFNFDF